MKALVGAFNQEKALVGAFSVIIQPVVEPMDRFTALIFSCLHFIFILHYLPHLALAEAELAVHVAVEWRGGRVVLHHPGRNVPLFQIEYHTVMVRVTSVWCDGATSAWRCAPWSGRGNTPSEERTRLGDTSGECPQTGPLPPGNIGIK